MADRVKEYLLNNNVDEYDKLQLFMEGVPSPRIEDSTAPRFASGSRDADAASSRRWIPRLIADYQHFRSTRPIEG